MKNFTGSFFSFLLCTLFLISGTVSAQQKDFPGIKMLKDGSNTALQTIPMLNQNEPEDLTAHLNGTGQLPGIPYVLGGNLLWLATDAQSISNTVRLNGDGSAPIVAWTLNQMRVSLYPTNSATPIWEFPTLPTDASTAISSDGNVIAVTKAQSFYLLNKNTGAVEYEMTLPDSFYASPVAVSRDGQRVVFAAQANGGSGTARAYCLNLSGGTPVVQWTYDVSVNEITNWAGVSISASGSHVVLTGRYHLYVLNASTGNVIWDRFVDNTESNTAVSGDGKVIATADNSGFVQTRLFNASTNEYDLLWQYRVPAGIYTNWASSVGISANGNTIVAGSMIFVSGTEYDGTIVAFDTYGNGTPKWIIGNAGDLVDEISVSDDGRVAAAVTWGDMAHQRPDLFVIDVERGSVTYSEVSAGSLFSVDLSPDGKKVIAGGKATHARAFGMGGLTYYSEINLGGGNVSGTVDLAGTTNESGVVVKALGTTRSAVTDANGNYEIRNIAPGTYTIRAEKPGYNFGATANVTVTEGATTSGINFTLNTFTQNPPVLTASNSLMNKIVLNWTGLMTDQRRKEIARITGDEYFPMQYDVVSRSAVQSKKQTADNELFIDSIAVYRSPAPGGPYALIGIVSTAVSTFEDNAVFPLKNYYYVINKFNETGQTVYSNEALGKVSDSLLTFSVVVPQSANVPTFDGILSPGEWTDAFKIDISDVFGYSGGTPKPQGSVFLYLKFNQTTKMLYAAGEDFLNTALDNNEGFGFYFDDNNSGNFEPTDALPVYQEGNYWAYWHPTGSLVRFRQLFTNGGVGVVDTLFDAPVAFSSSSGHVTGEFAIPMGFMKRTDLQIYGPDKIAGLGAFLIARDGAAALFNGWWPQTMNSVFNAQYFGDVNINVNLTAPPKAPSDIAVARQGNYLNITWSDPEEGLNNDPLPAAPVIKIFKNGEYFATVNGGVESFVDEDVECARWYEYHMEAYIVVGTDTLLSPLSNTVGEFACITPALVPIKYDDGIFEAFYVVDFTYDENKFAVKFTPTFFPARVMRMETTVNSKKPFEYTINSDSSGFPGKVLAGPYISAATGSSIVGKAAFTLPGNEPPLFETAQDYWVLINYLPTSPDAPGVGVDQTPPNAGRSMFYTATGGWTALTQGNLMVTSYIADPPPVGVEDEIISAPLKYDLMQNYPNPFNPSTLIRYQIPENQMVSVEIFNALGQKIRTLVNEVKDPGSYSITWDGFNSSGKFSPSGIYFCRIKAGDFTSTIKMMMLK